MSASVAVLLAGIARAATIEGQVTTADGSPLPGASVIAYDARLSYVYTETADDGTYALLDVPDGEHRIRVLPSMLDNVQESWWPEGLNVCDSAVVPAGDQHVDVELHVGGMITGQLRDPAGQPVVAALVIARPDNAGSTQLRTARTDVNGRFRLRGLAPLSGDHGSFKLEVQASGFPRQFVGPTYDPALAQKIDARPGEETADEDRTLLQGIAVGGAVFGPDGAAAEGAVKVYSPSEIATTTIVDGRYLARGLPPGFVQAWSYVDGLALTYAPSSDRPGAGIAVLAEGQLYDSLDITAPAEATFLGELHGGGLPIEGINVLAWNDDHTVAAGAVADVDGAFVIHGLHAGRYTLWVYGSERGFLDDWSRDEAGAVRTFDLPGAAAFEVPLVVGGHVSGVVTDSSTGLPVYGATIEATPVADGEPFSTETALTGIYDLRGLPAGSYRLSARYEPYCRGDRSWAPTYYPGTPNPLLGGGVRIDGDAGVVWDASLPPDLDRDGMDDAWESANGLDPARDDASEDADGDGFANLDEYRLGTDPNAVVEEPPGCGCASTATFGLAPWLLAGAMLRTRRR